MNNFFNDDLDQYLHEIISGESNADQKGKEDAKKIDNIPSHSTKKEEKSSRLKSTSSLCLKNINPQIKEEHFSMSPPEEELSPHSLDKKERNRMAAKQSRDRKKLYIELMEYEQKKLEAELSDVGSEIDEVKNKINKFTAENKTITGFSTTNQLQIKLKQILEKNDIVQQEEEIMIVLDSMSFRMGATGKERLQKQKECHKQMLNLFLPPLHRYVMWAAPEGKHIWGSNFNEMEDFQCSLIPEVVKMNEIPDEMQMFREKVKETKERLLNLINTLEEKKENVEKIIKNLEEQVDFLRDILTSSQCAKLLIFANNNRYRKELLFFEEDEIEPSILQSSAPKKKVKKEKEPNTE